MVEPADTPETLGLREFAERIGKKPSYVTQLKQEGRLALTPDGRRVLVAESLRLIADSAHPAKAGVAARHAAGRATAAATLPPPAQAGDGGADVAPEEAPVSAEPPAAPDDPIARQRAAEQLAQEKLKRRALERTEAKELGQLLEREPTLAALANFITVLRNDLQGIPARLAPRLCALDEAACQALLGDEIEHALETLERKFLKLGRDL